MELNSLICKEARTGPDGRLDIHGVFNELYAPGFPARQDRLVLVAILQWEEHDEGRVAFTIELEDPEGVSVFTVTGHTDIEPRGPTVAPPKTQLVLPLHNTGFPQPGRYRFRLQVGDSHYEGPSLFVLAAPDGPEVSL